jgi:3-mercaptopyruvate sulfurtransferase SseA
MKRILVISVIFTVILLVGCTTPVTALTTITVTAPPVTITAPPITVTAPPATITITVTALPTSTPTPTTTPTPNQLSIDSPLTAQQVHALLQSNPSVIIIDTRSTEEYTGVVAAGASVGHIPGAYSVPDVGNVAEQLYRFPDKTRLYICYCDTAACSHAWTVASIMSAAGYTNVTYMSDGIAGWTAQGYSLETGE